MKAVISVSYVRIGRIVGKKSLFGRGGNDFRVEGKNLLDVLLACLSLFFEIGIYCSMEIQCGND